MLTNATICLNQIFQRYEGFVQFDLDKPQSLLKGTTTVQVKNPAHLFDVDLAKIMAHPSFITFILKYFNTL